MATRVITPGRVGAFRSRVLAGNDELWAGFQRTWPVYPALERALCLSETSCM